MDDASPALDPASGPALPPDLPLPPLERINDFPDGISPMLVKELRQGLRTHTFVILFLVLQGLLALVLMTTGAATSASSSDGAGDVVSQIIFCFFSLALLVIQPLRGVSSISLEIKQNTIDLMVLTRLSAWRIVWGKWCSIVSQSGLILLAILPYLILRYFFGGMQLFAELFLMLYIFIISGTLTAITVGLSAVSNVIIRGMIPIAGSIAMGIFVLWGLTPSLYVFVGYLLPSSHEFLGAIGFLALALYIGYFFLELGATMIAPAAENRATRKRLVGLAVLTGSYWILQAMDPDIALAGALVVMGLLSLDILTERADFPRIVCGPFLRFGTLGRFLGRFLYPGYASGTLFFAFLTILLVAFLMLQTKLQGPDLQTWATTGTSIAVMIFPAAIMQLFARKSTQRFSLYISLQLISFTLAVIFSALFDYLTDKTLLWIFCPIPTVLFPLIDEVWATGNQLTITFVTWVLAGLYYLLVLAGTLPLLGRMNRLENEQLNREDYGS